MRKGPLKMGTFQASLTDPNSAPKALKGEDNFVVTSESTHASLFDDIRTEGGSNMVGKISRTPDREDF